MLSKDVRRSIRPSVCLSICLSHAGIMLLWITILISWLLPALILLPQSYPPQKTACDRRMQPVVNTCRLLCCQHSLYNAKSNNRWVSYSASYCSGSRPILVCSKRYKCMTMAVMMMITMLTTTQN